MYNRRQWNITWRGSEVHSPAGRVAVTLFVVPMALLGVLFALVSLVVLIPLSLPIHALVRALGGKGFYEPRTGSYSVPAWASLLIIAAIILSIVAVT